MTNKKTVAIMLFLMVGISLITADLSIVHAESATIELSDSHVVVNLNTATLEELQVLNGLGPALAARVVHYREENGPFEQIEDIMNVRGVGQGTFDKIQQSIEV